MKTSNGQGPIDNNDEFSDAAMIDSSLQDESQAWQGNEAPIDDFNDPASEGIARVTEATESMEGVPLPTSHDEPKNNKMLKLLPLAAGVGGVIFIGAMLYLQFGSAPTSPVAMLPPKPPAASHAEFPAALTAESNEAVAPTSSLTPLAAISQNAAASARPSTPTEQKGIAFPGANSLNPTTTQPSVATAEPTSAVPDKKPSPNEAASLAASLPAAAAPESKPDITASAPPTSSSAIDDLQPVTAAALIARPAPSAAKPAAAQTTAVDALAPAENARMDQLSSQIEALQKELAATQQQLAQANERLQEFQAEKPSSGKSQQSQSATLSVGDDNFFKAQEKSALLSSTKKKNPAVHKTQNQRKASRATAKKSNADSQVWVLRAATPDEAWVAKGENSRAIQPVHVGETLQGIGQITAIRQDGDRWIVEGTQGMVR